LTSYISVEGWSCSCRSGWWRCLASITPTKKIVDVAHLDLLYILTSHRDRISCQRKSSLILWLEKRGVKRELGDVTTQDEACFRSMNAIVVINHHQERSDTVM
jgi:hypothetical protein